ncbi:hypothetical protein JCM33374_g367 [Metschnikowia sp. JCM 33374]|nr:hypothetical protein JCM33374_g367 [Metschnikowia sp. JCM 33374]
MKFKLLVVAALSVNKIKGTFTTTSINKAGKKDNMYQEHPVLGIARKDILSKRGNMTSVAHAKSAYRNYLAENVELFIWSVKRFSSGKSFDAKGFDLNSRHLRQTLLDLSASIENLSPYSPSLSHHLTYAKELYRKTMDLSELLKFFPRNNGKASNLIHKVIQTNLRLMTFLDSKGALNSQVKESTEMISQIVDDMTGWENKFNSLPRLPLSVKLAFDVVFKEANVLLNILAIKIFSFKHE